MKAKTVVVLVAAMMISSALMAAPNANSKNCSAPSTDGATWGGSGGGPLRISSAPAGTLNNSCPGNRVTLSTDQTRSEKSNGLAHAFGKFLSGLGISFDGATWGGTGGFGPPR